MSNFNALIELLGEENVERIKSSISDMLIRRMEDDLEDYGGYILYPPDIQDTVADTVESVKKKIEKMYKTAIIEINQEYIDKMKGYMAGAFDGDKQLRTKIADLARWYLCQGNEHSKEREFSNKLYSILSETQEFK